LGEVKPLRRYDSNFPTFGEASISDFEILSDLLVNHGGPFIGKKGPSCRSAASFRLGPSSPGLLKLARRRLFKVKLSESPPNLARLGLTAMRRGSRTLVDSQCPRNPFPPAGALVHTAFAELRLRLMGTPFSHMAARCRTVNTGRALPPTYPSVGRRGIPSPSRRRSEYGIILIPGHWSCCQPKGMRRSSRARDRFIGKNWASGRSATSLRLGPIFCWPAQTGLAARLFKVNLSESPPSSARLVDGHAYFSTTSKTFLRDTQNRP
jgi:hypothetical protein